MLSHNLNLKVFFEEVISFSVVGIISILSVAKIREFSEITMAPISWLQFLLAFGIGTVIVFGIIRITHGGFLLRLFFLLAIFSGIWVTIGVFLNNSQSFILSLILAVIYNFYPYVWFHNIILILTLPGIVSMLGASFRPQATIIFLIFMSIYDYIAVYKTKHMVVMAKAMIAGRAISAMIFPEHWRGFKSHLNDVRPGEGFMILGTGDFIFPMIMATSAYAISAATAWIVFAASLFGLLLMHLIFISQKVRRPMPALPPLAAFAILGFLIAVIFHF